MNADKLQKILFTRKLTDKHYCFGKKMGLLIEDHPFIEIKLSNLCDEIIADIELYDNAYWVFTSKNAVKSVLKSLPGISNFTDRKCFSVGKKTADVLREYNFEVIVPEYYNAEYLVDCLESEGLNNMYFYFSGNMRRKTISNFFKENEIEHREVECYKTSLIQPIIEVDQFDAVCFCSPSAVTSFFQKYQLKKEVPCIAIGNTTAVKLLDYTENVAMSEKTNIYSMFEICNEYLNS